MFLDAFSTTTKAKAPNTIRYLKKVAEDFYPSMAFALSRRKQQQALEELSRCKCIADYLTFTRRWLGKGACQKVVEIEAALNYIRSEEPRHVCEIGTLAGGTTLLLSRTLPSVNLIIGVDIYIENRPRLQRLRPVEQNMHLLNGSSYAASTVRRVEKILRERKLDLLFIDGDHRYEGVKKDFQTYSRLVRENGLVVFHDIIQDHAVRYGKPTQSYAGGVPTLWKELKQKYDSREFITDPDQDGLGLGVLRYSSSPNG
jgi:predicted O-methyltransferase YrrM